MKYDPIATLGADAQKHREQAIELLNQAYGQGGIVYNAQANLIAAAQVHATLALSLAARS